AIGASMTKVREAVDRTSRWAEKCRKYHQVPAQLLFGIVQGGTFSELRHQSAADVVSLDFPGYAIGGLSIGEPKETTWSIVDETVPSLPPEKPRYLMGVGSPEDIIEGISRGIDIFDSALPTRVARNGALFTTQGRINIRKAVYRTKEQPVDADCDCYTCRTFSAAYLNHLFKCEELLAYRLATIHNLSFVAKLMQRIQNSIQQGTFANLKDEFLSQYQVTDEEVRIAQKQKWLNSPRRQKGVS
ncbi:MAG: tRNA-guanine transglycosylase, partial [Chloroflexota bacterium]